MKCDSCPNPVSWKDRFWSGVIGLEAALFIKFILMIVADYGKIPFPFGVQEGSAFVVGLVVLLLVSSKVKNAPCPGCLHQAA